MATGLLSRRPRIHNRANGDVAIDGRGESNGKMLRTTALLHFISDARCLVATATGTIIIVTSQCLHGLFSACNVAAS